MSPNSSLFDGFYTAEEVAEFQQLQSGFFSKARMEGYDAGFKDGYRQGAIEEREGLRFLGVGALVGGSVIGFVCGLFF